MSNYLPVEEEPLAMISFAQYDQTDCQISQAVDLSFAAIE